MEEEGDIEHDSVGEDGSREVREDNARAGVVCYDRERHDGEGDIGFGIYEGRKGYAEDDERRNDKWMRPGVNVPSEVLDEMLACFAYKEGINSQDRGSKR